MNIGRALFFMTVLLIATVCGVWVFLSTNYWIDVATIEQCVPGRPTIILDDEGREWMRFQIDRREPIPLSHMSEQLIQAFLAAEDWNFFSHAGISWKGIVRSIAVNMYRGGKIQGASTITQQLVKMLFLGSQKTFSRKLKEQLYALVIEQQFSKRQILELYLNHIYFGCGIYGVEAAAQRFWKKSAAQLTLDQAATLACIVKSPAHYCPLLCPLSCEKRRNVILNSLYRREAISKSAWQQAVATPVHVLDVKDEMCGWHVKEMLRCYLEEKVGKDQLYSGGFVVQTTLNRTMQNQAEAIFTKHIMRIRHDLKKPADGGLFCCDVKTGEIKTIIGGYDFHNSQFNRALARRQIGSGFKPLIYAAALEHGMSFSDVETDEPICVMQDQSEWTPKNFNCCFNGPITRAYALSHSNNIVTVKTLLEVGLDAVINLAKRCHLGGPFYPYPSLALGCVDGTLKEVASMFNVFANDGVYVEPYYVAWIKDRWGTKIYKHDAHEERVMSSRVAAQVAKVLELSLKRIHHWFDNWIDSQAISKTGTTNDSRTCWYVGSTPSLTTAVYVGCDDNQPLGKNIYPVKTAFPIWIEFNRHIGSSIKQFSRDASLQSVFINERTGKLCCADDLGAIEILV